MQSADERNRRVYSTPGTVRHYARAVGLQPAEQTILQEAFGITNLAELPQMWGLNKEVGGYYQDGLTVPNDITLLWPDDNSGNLERLPAPTETNRSGGAGIHYHFDYFGGPRDYKWINTISLAKTWEQMHLAYENNANRIWVVNAGDLKPLISYHLAVQTSTFLWETLAKITGYPDEPLPRHGI